MRNGVSRSGSAVPDAVHIHDNEVLVVLLLKWWFVVGIAKSNISNVNTLLLKQS